jgi:tetratricopeptide (TPR) repeat protein
MRIRLAIVFGGLLALAQTGCVNPNGTSRSASPLPPAAPPAAPVASAASPLAEAGRGGEKSGSDLAPADSAKLCVATAEQLESANKLPDAIPLYEKARQLDPRTDARVTRSLANLYTRIGEFDRAKQEFDRALRATPNSAEVLNDLGYAYYCRGMWQEAETYLRKAVAANAKQGRAWTNLGMTLGQQGRYDESVDAFRHVVSPGKAYCNVAFLMATQGRRDQAIAAYREALKVEPDLQLARTGLDRLESSARVAQTAQAAQAGSANLPSQAGDAGRTPIAPVSTARRNP